jgi:hypothetical protein
MAVVVGLLAFDGVGGIDDMRVDLPPGVRGHV